MAWFNVDDQLAMHPKVLEAGNAAIGLWVRAGSWSSAQLSDGFVPKILAKSFGKPAEIRSLINVGLWSEVEGGYQFKDWGEYQRSSAEIKAKREAERVRKSRWRSRTCPGGTDAENVVGRDLSNTNTNTKELKDLSDAPTAKEPEGFAAWWATYPKKSGKGQARTAYRAALKKETADVLLAAAVEYLEDPTRKPDYTKNPATWLNGECWADEKPEASKRVIREWE